MKSYRWYIYLILTLALTLNWVVVGSDSFDKTNLNLNLLPKKAIILIELLQVILLAFLAFFYNRKKFVLNSIILVSIFVSFQLLVHLALDQSLTIWISGIRHYFSFFPLFLLGYILSLKKYTIDREFKLILFILFLQIPLVIYQYFKAIAVISVRGAALFDVVSGSMGGFASNLLSAVLCFGIVYYLIKYLDTSKIINLLWAFLLIIPPILASSKGMYVILLVIIAYLIKGFKISVTNVIKISSVAILIIIGFVLIFNEIDVGGKSIDVSFLLDYVQAESGRGRLSRIDSIVYASKLIFNEGSPLFGMGIGSANSNPIGATSPFDNPFTIRDSADILITEVGFLGVIVVIGLLFKLFQMSQRVVKKLPSESKFNRHMALLLGGMVIVLLISLLWDNMLFRVQFMYPFGLLSGYVVGLDKNLKKSRRNI